MCVRLCVYDGHCLFFYLFLEGFHKIVFKQIMFTMILGIIMIMMMVMMIMMNMMVDINIYFDSHIPEETVLFGSFFSCLCLRSRARRSTASFSILIVGLQKKSNFYCGLHLDLDIPSQRLAPFSPQTHTLVKR